MQSFKGVIRLSGNVHIVTVPAQYIKDDHLLPGREYLFIVQETEEGEAQE